MGSDNGMRAPRFLLSGLLPGLSAVLLAGLLAGCADRLEMGLPVAPPALTDDAAITADGARLPLMRWQPPNGEAPRAVVLALHGYNDYANAFDAAGTYWAAEGISTYAYDQRGFGRSDRAGLWSSVEALSSDAAATLWQLHDRYPDTPLFLLGHSMGGAIATTVATRTGAAGLTVPPLTGLILEAPAVWTREEMPGYQRLVLEVAAWAVPGLRVSPEGLDIVASDNTEMLRSLGRDPLVLKDSRVDTLYGLTTLMDSAFAAAPDLPGNTLMLYGDREEVVPLDTVDTMLAQIPADHLTLAFYEDGYHMLLRDLQAPVVWDDIVAWMTTAGGPLPSGADRRGAARHEAVLFGLSHDDDTYGEDYGRDHGAGIAGLRPDAADRLPD